MYSLDPADQSTEDHETEFELYSDRMTRIAPDLEIQTNNALKLYPGKNSPVINLKKHIELLLSKDLSRNSELDWIAGNKFRFLDGERIDG